MRHVHFVGSIGLDTVDTVLDVVSRKVGKFVRRCPDGEPGGRRMWIGWQYALLRTNPDLKVNLNKLLDGGVGLCELQLAGGVDPADLHFGELGYAREAWASYQQFKKVRGRGEFAKDTRFQVCLPTPLAVIGAFVAKADVGKVLPAYQAAMVEEVKRLVDLIPGKDLAIQWDVCVEMIMWDGRFPGIPRPPHLEEMIRGSFTAITAPIPAEVELGVHLCYGDLDGAHFVDPIDLSNAVGLGNFIMDTVEHPLAWVHMPVLPNRRDRAFYQPIADLRLDAGGELFLGVVHGDGIDKIRERIHAAKSVREDFGVATECGISRARTIPVVNNLLDLHAQAAASD